MRAEVSHRHPSRPRRWSLSLELKTMKGIELWFPSVQEVAAPTASRATDCRTRPTAERQEADTSAKRSCRLLTSRPRCSPGARVEVLPDVCGPRHPWWLRRASQCWHCPFFPQGMCQDIGEAPPHKLRRHSGTYLRL